MLQMDKLPHYQIIITYFNGYVKHIRTFYFYKKYAKSVYKVGKLCYNNFVYVQFAEVLYADPQN